MTHAGLNCFFVSDLHGQSSRYEKLFTEIVSERPDVVLLGGDILPGNSSSGVSSDFILDYLIPRLKKLRVQLAEKYPVIFIIMGNDDPRCEEGTLLASSQDRLFLYMHGQQKLLSGFRFYGYAHVPPTPFLLKDWERYDVSRYIPPGCVSPEEGYRTLIAPEQEIKWRTIQRDLEELVCEDSLDRAIFLMHAPPYETPLDCADLAGRLCDHVPLDPHVGSIAVRRFIEQRQPLMTLHGHVHESTLISGEWKTQIGRTVCISAAHHGPELALVRFDPGSPTNATRELI